MKFATVHSLSESINLKLLLDRAQIPFWVANETLGLYTLVNASGTSMLGPIEFYVPGHLVQEAQDRIKELFSVEPHHLPDACPACEAPAKGHLECPGCGLSLC